MSKSAQHIEETSDISVVSSQNVVQPSEEDRKKLEQLDALSAWAKQKGYLKHVVGLDSASTQIVPSSAGQIAPPSATPSSLHTTASLPALNVENAHKVPWIERELGLSDMEALLSQWLQCAEGGTAYEATGRDFGYILVTGGSGVGKTRTGIELPTLLREQTRKFGILHDIYSKEVISELEPHSHGKSSTTKSSDTSSSSSGKEMTQQYHRPPHDPAAEAQTEQWLIDRLASHYGVINPNGALSLVETLEAIRKRKQIHEREPLLIYFHLDEIQQNLPLITNFLRCLCRILTVIPNAFAQTYSCIIPILTGTCAGDLRLASTLVPFSIHLTGFANLDQACQFFLNSWNYYTQRTSSSSSSSKLLTSSSSPSTPSLQDLASLETQTKPGAFINDSSKETAPIPSSASMLTLDMPKSHDHPNHLNMLSSLAFIPRLIRLYAGIRVRYPNLDPANVDDWKTIFSLTQSAIASHYYARTSSTLSDHLLCLWYLNIPIKSTYVLNEVGLRFEDAKKKHSFIFSVRHRRDALQLPCEDTFQILVPLIFAISWRPDLFDKDSFKFPLGNTGKDRLPQLCLERHHATYHILGMHANIAKMLKNSDIVRKYKLGSNGEIASVRTSLREIYAGAAEGLPSLLDAKIWINPNIVVADRPQSWKKADSQHNTNPVRCLFEAPPLNSGPDALTPHAAEQYKADESYSTSGTAKGANITARTVLEEVKKTKAAAQTHPTLTIITPKKITGIMLTEAGFRVDDTDMEASSMDVDRKEKTKSKRRSEEKQRKLVKNLLVIRTEQKFEAFARIPFGSLIREFHVVPNLLPSSSSPRRRCTNCREAGHNKASCQSTILLDAPSSVPGALAPRSPKKRLSEGDPGEVTLPSPKKQKQCEEE